MTREHRRTVSWTRTEDGNHDVSINMSTARLILSTIAAAATAVTTTIGLAVLLLKPAAEVWVTGMIENSIAPLVAQQQLNTKWIQTHQASYEAGRAWMTAEDARARAERNEMLSEIRYIRERVDALWERRAR